MTMSRDVTGSNDVTGSDQVSAEATATDGASELDSTSSDTGSSDSTGSDTGTVTAEQGGRTGRSPSVLIRVHRALPNLRPAEQRVAQAVLDDPAGVSESSITTVAKRCQTSETTVLRFCRAIGLDGYPELRIALARAAQWEENDQDVTPITGKINADDSLADVVSKISHADARGITDTAHALDLGVLEQAVDALAAAQRIDIFGFGASALVGQDLHHKLHRIGRTAFSWSDAHLALTSAAVLGAEDVAIGFSHSGTTIDTIDALRVAQRHGARTIAVTNFDKSPISEVADLVLVTAANETAFRSGAMSSRIAQLSLVDCLFVAVAQRSYDAAIEALESTYAAVESRRDNRRVR